MPVSVPRPASPRSGSPRSSSSSSTTVGRAVAVASVLVALWVLAGAITGPVGAAVAASLPWVGVLAVVLVVTSLLRARRAVIVPLAALVVWVVAMLPVLPAPAGAADSATLTVASQNVRANSSDVASTVSDLVDTGAGVIALTELDAASRASATTLLADTHPHSYAVGTVGVWSTAPVSEAEPLSLGLGWSRALRVTAETPEGPVRLYLLHASSIRPGRQGDRDTMLRALAAEIAADPSKRVLAVGDFNAAPSDPALGDLRDALDWVRPTGVSPGFTWPAALPLVRIDHAFERGLDAVSATTVRAGVSDHRATLTALRFTTG